MELDEAVVAAIHRGLPVVIGGRRYVAADELDELWRERIETLRRQRDHARDDAMRYLAQIEKYVPPDAPAGKVLAYLGEIEHRAQQVIDGVFVGVEVTPAEVARFILTGDTE